MKRRRIATLAGPVLFADGITFRGLTSGQSATDAASYASASIAPGANKLILLAFETANTDPVPSVVPTVTGNGLTWVEINSVEHTITGTRFRVGVFRAMGAAPSAGAVTLSYGAVVQIGQSFSIVEVYGIDTSGTNGSGAIVQSVLGNSAGGVTSLAITLAALGSPNNFAYGAFHHAINQTNTPGAGFTTLHNAAHASPASSLITEYKANATTVDASWLSSSDAGGVAIEIKAA